MSNTEISVRVISGQLSQYVGQHVRLVGKTIRITQETALIEATDGGQVEVRMPGGVALAGEYNEIVGTVVDERTIKMLIGINLGDELDMKLVNDIVLLTHDPRWRDRMFRS